MAYSKEVVARARARLAEAREDRESENRQHLQEAYERVPRIRQIDMELRKTMALTARLAFTTGSDTREAMEQVKKQNLSLQREREYLIRENFEEGFLDESPICDHCGGLGYVGANMCECLRELCRQEQKRELTLLSVASVTFDQFVLDYYPNRFDPKLRENIREVMEKTFKTCREFAMNFSGRSGSMLFSGDTGLGKTFLAACIARAVAERGYSVMYESAPHLFAKMERAKFSGDEDARRNSEKYTQCDLLIVDDLGTEMPSQFVTAALYLLVNDRLLSGKSTIISTNLRADDLDYRYSPQIASRLRGSYKRVAFLGEDIRPRKSW